MSVPNSPKNKNRQISQYQKFRMNRLKDNTEDDNQSAHFSNTLSNNPTDRQQHLGLNGKIQIKNLQLKGKSDEKRNERQSELSKKLQDKQKQCNEISAKYEQLIKKYDTILIQKEYYKKKYEQKLAKDKQTKKKLQGWIQSAKTDLFETE